jgi:hypothetical protein
MAPPETTTTEPPSEEDAILAAVDGYWQSFLDANDPPDPNHPDLARYRTGDALETAVANINDRIKLGQAIRLPSDSVYGNTSHVEAINGEEADVLSCSIDDSVLYDRASGSVLNDRVSTFEFRLTLVKDNGLWKVSTGTQLHRWEGVSNCAWE